MTDLRNLPSIDSLVAKLRVGALPRAIVVEIARQAVDTARVGLRAGNEADPSSLAQREINRLTEMRIQRTINAAGVLLHTNLGRAPIHPDAAAGAVQAGIGYSNIEFDLGSGERGKRGDYLHRLITEATGAEAAFVVNNNAGALFLTLAGLAKGGSVPVSRGELIEIGGSYRLPDLMAASGTSLIEVGTTNRTRIGDYEAALDATTALLLKVHPSNYRVMGFAEDTPVAELAATAASKEVPFVYDVGSGLLDETAPWLAHGTPAWAVGEPGVRQTLEAGTDLVTFSGDKLLGGPQAGILAGSAELIEKLRKSPIARAQRIDGATLAALTITFEMYLNGAGAEIPFWAMVSRSDQELRDRLVKVAEGAGVDPLIRASDALAGAGSVPGMTMPSPVLAVTKRPADELWQGLLQARPAIVARRDAGELLLDLRTVDPSDDHHIAAVLRTLCLS